ncbi:hypothetical protein QFC20_007576 [Naganishia adeliensis]|uniref:Uncharacterized protein n=1 Tax=Naganishia adeliensis TaxID=92952 RepID=A0ACC2UZ86_9TREE|nr:hypothetical protein QFC20_007576 [Naganishia adeliensis]
METTPATIIPFRSGEVLREEEAVMITWEELMLRLESEIHSLCFPPGQHADGSLLGSSRAWLEEYLTLVEQYRKDEPSRYSAHKARIGLDMGAMVAEWLSRDRRLARRAGKVVREMFLYAWGDGFAASFKIAFNIMVEAELFSPLDDPGVHGSASFGSQPVTNAMGAPQASPGSSTIQSLADDTWASVLGLTVDETEGIDTLAEQALSELVESSWTSFPATE